MVKKNIFFAVLVLVSSFSLGLKAQVDLSDATMSITDLTAAKFAEGTNEITINTKNSVKLTLVKVGGSTTSSITPAGTVTCDGVIGNSIVNLMVSTASAPNDYSYIQLENLGTSNITHVAFRGWYNVSGNDDLTYGFSETGIEGSFSVPLDGSGWEDSPLKFEDNCSIGTTFDGSGKLEVPEGTKFIRLSSSPDLALPFPMFSNTNVAVYGIYIWTDNNGPTGVGEVEANFDIQIAGDEIGRASCRERV